MNARLRRFALACGVASLALYAGGAPAGVIMGGSTMLSPSYLAQLETWLGEGSLAR